MILSALKALEPYNVCYFYKISNSSGSIFSSLNERGLPIPESIEVSLIMKIEFELSTFLILVKKNAIGLLSEIIEDSLSRRSSTAISGNSIVDSKYGEEQGHERRESPWWENGLRRRKNTIRRPEFQVRNMLPQLQEIHVLKTTTNYR
ncbi:hypothetical protein PanWU01x14_022970 [Parasponia andersonii]|uniref:Uncharacterized protein n=1 Tax=Parasponia andersonii TaxID=3476 RepID=A0A2P5DXD9_PARAD|nr:hypothetical protein PanWU01x14_022970 [Parasponia andersonii]